MIILSWSGISMRYNWKDEMANYYKKIFSRANASVKDAVDQTLILGCYVLYYTGGQTCIIQEPFWL